MPKRDAFLPENIRTKSGLPFTHQEHLAVHGRVENNDAFAFEMPISSTRNSATGIARAWFEGCRDIEPYVKSKLIFGSFLAALRVELGVADRQLAESPRPSAPWPSDFPIRRQPPRASRAAHDRHKRPRHRAADFDFTTIDSNK